jgi:cytochrome P450
LLSQDSDTNLHAQTAENEMVSALRSQVTWVPFPNDMNPFSVFNPIRPFMIWYNARKMNRYIENLLDDRFEVGRARSAESSKRSKPIIDLALEAYLKEDEASKEADKKMDSTFKRFAVDQIKIFMFAGHDTTSSAVSYMYHLLHKNGHALDMVRREHDVVFGLDVDLTSQIIAKNPHVLNKLQYTDAIIKETLRLFPPANTARAGQPGYYMEHDGIRYPTEGFIVSKGSKQEILIEKLTNYQKLNISSNAIHERADLYHEPTEFIPERWLNQEEGGEPGRTQGAWRPFENGPRNCIGQTLAMIEIKIIMALTLRKFEIWSVYDEVDARSSSKKINHAGNERAYQTFYVSAKPADGMPARVKRR